MLKWQCLDIHPLGETSGIGWYKQMYLWFRESLKPAFRQQQVNAFPSLSATRRGNAVIVQRYTIVPPIETPSLTVNKRWAARWWFTSLLKRPDLLFLSTLNDTASSVMQISIKQRAWALLFVCRTRRCRRGWFFRGSRFQAASQHTLRSTFGRTYSMGLTLLGERLLLLGSAETFLAISAALRPVSPQPVKNAPYLDRHLTFSRYALAAASVLELSNMAFPKVQL